MIDVGDLVNCRDYGQRIGLVVDKRMSNEGLECSMHTRHLLNIYSKVYYVFFSGLGRTGPHHEADLVLQQSAKPA